jgi:DNA-binding response OmpR family regulator
MRRILIIDDDATNREILKWELCKDCEVEEMSTGEGAAAVIADGDHDLVLLDQMMPFKSGMEVVEELRAQAPAKLDRVVLVTAALTRELVASAGRFELAGAVERPYLPEEIRALVDRFCPGGSASQEAS